MTHMIREWEASGMNGRKFCETRNISYWTFQYWKKKVSGNFSGFTELRMNSGSNAPEIVIRLSSGISVVVNDGFNPATLRKVIAALSES